MTHRDVGQVLPSVCALYEAFAGVLSDRRDPAGIGRGNTAVWMTSLERSIAFRDNSRAERFCDLHFEDVQRDPLGAVSRLYAALGDELTDDARTSMAAWWQRNQARRPPPHRYEAADYGLDLEVIAAQFAFYHDRFVTPTDAT
jgi:hypothetical protein